MIDTEFNPFEEDDDEELEEPGGSFVSTRPRPPRGSPGFGLPEPKEEKEAELVGSFPAPGCW